MSKNDAGSGLKSAYEAALERLEQRGIERPREEALTEEVRRRMSEVRSKAEAQLAELEIMHRQRLRHADPTSRRQEEEDYRRERQRIEERREHQIRQLRGEG